MGGRGLFLSNLPSLLSNGSLYLSQAQALPTSTGEASHSRDRQHHTLLWKRQKLDAEWANPAYLVVKVLGRCMCMTRCDAVLGIAAAGPRTCMRLGELCTLAQHMHHRDTHPERSEGGLLSLRPTNFVSRSFPRGAAKNARRLALQLGVTDVSQRVIPDEERSLVGGVAYTANQSSTHAWIHCSVGYCCPTNPPGGQRRSLLSSLTLTLFPMHNANRCDQK